MPLKQKLYILLSGSIGNFILMYDTIIYQYLAKEIGEAFLPQNENTFFWTQVIFILGLLARPISAICFSVTSDISGRRLILQNAVLLSGTSTAMIAFLPTYNSAGIATTIALIFLRIAGNVATGGEYVASMAYLIEHSSPKRIGFVVSMGGFGINLGMLAAGFMSSSIFIDLLPSSNEIPAWRILFGLSIFLSMFGFWIRKNTSEPLDFIVNNSKYSQEPVKKYFRSLVSECKANAHSWIKIVSMALIGNVSTYVVFLSTKIFFW